MATAPSTALPSAAALQPTSFSPVHTGDTVFVRFNKILVGFVQNWTPTRSINRIQVHQVGTPLIVDAPAGAANVQVTLTNLIPQDPILGLRAMGVTPHGSLAGQVTAAPFNMTLHATYLSGAPSIYTVLKCLWSQDSLQIVQTTQATYTVTFIGQDATMGE